MSIGGTASSIDIFSYAMTDATVICDGNAGIKGRRSVTFLGASLNVVSVLAGVAGLITHLVQKVVEARCETGSEQGTEEVDPKVVREAMVDDGWAERAGKVEGATSEVDTLITILASFKNRRGIGGQGDIPQSSVKKKVKPMPTGAKKVDLCLTTASMIMTKTNWAVRNISIKRP
jgi:hypothetical protein